MEEGFLHLMLYNIQLKSWYAYSVLFSEQSTRSVQTVIHDSALGVKSSTAIIDVDSGEFYISIQTDDRLRTVTVSTGKIVCY